MKKLLFLISLLSIFSFLLISCDNNTTSTPESTIPAPSTSAPIPTTDPYTTIDTEYFYQYYTESTSYEDANYRTEHHLVSGSINDDDRNYLPTSYSLDTVYKSSNTTLTYREDNSYESYTINYINGYSKTIYYGGGYVALDEVVAYIYAFGEVPPNSNYGTSNRNKSIDDWGKYGRCNIGRYSNDTSKYRYEPELPTVSSSGTVYTYTETDFGSTGGFTVDNSRQTEYNDGSSINRGTCRIVFTNNAKDITERHVFYTYNHYNDFQEYLNYGGGFGRRFGNESNGGTYNQGSNPSPYIFTANVTFEELRRKLTNA